MYSWHKDFYHKAFDKTYIATKKKLHEHGIQLVDFWPWVEANHTEAYRKYTSACETISALCKSNAPVDMERFKTAVQQEMQGLEYFIDKYIAAHKSSMSDESNTNLQEAAARHAISSAG